MQRGVLTGKHEYDQNVAGLSVGKKYRGLCVEGAFC